MTSFFGCVLATGLESDSWEMGALKLKWLQHMTDSGGVPKDILPRAHGYYLPSRFEVDNQAGHSHINLNIHSDMHVRAKQNYKRSFPALCYL